jgi:hypothetical protein
MGAARIDRCVRWGLLAVAVATAPLAAQKVIVRVVANGVPVPSAEVSLWGEGERLASAKTSESGLVSFVLTKSSPQDAYVTARRMGFAPGRAFADADTVTVSLAATATPLPVLAVKTRPLNCPVAADTAAMRLWQAAAARYGGDQRTLYFGWVGTTINERVAADQRGYGDDEHGESRLGMWTPAAQDPQLEQSPPVYASYLRSRNVLGEFEQWVYAPLGSVAAWHFATKSFAESHTLTVLGRTQDATILGFCSTSRGEADIEGELEVGDDSLFRSARWWFRVPHDDEDAGGEATFGVGQFGGRPYLVAIRGSHWRRAGRHLYEQERFELAAWRFGTTAASITTGWTDRGDLGAASP